MPIKEHGKQQNIEHKQKGELYFLIILLILFSVFLIDALKYEGVMEGRINGSGVIPQFVSVLVLIMIAMLAIKTFERSDKRIKIVEILRFLFCREVIIMITMITLYAILIEKIHFVPTTMFFLFFTMLFLDKTKIGNKLVVSTCTIASILVIFRYIFNIILP